MSIKNTVSDFSPYLFSTLNKHCFKIQSVLGDMYCFFNTVFICIRYIYKKCCYNSVWNFVIWSYWYFECLDMNLLKMYLLLLSEKVLHVPLEGDCKHPVTWWHWSLVELHCDVQPGPNTLQDTLKNSYLRKTRVCKLCICNIETNDDQDWAYVLNFSTLMVSRKGLSTCTFSDCLIPDKFSTTLRSSKKIRNAELTYKYQIDIFKNWNI